MDCNKKRCKGTTQVVDSRPHYNLGYVTIRRRRRCLKCSSRFSTYEMKPEDFARLMQLEKTLSTFAEIFQTLQQDAETTTGK